MPRTPPDFLYPTGAGKNRNEYFLVEFDDILQSSVEMVLYGTLLLPEERAKYPGLDAIDLIEPKEFYYDWSLVDPGTFLLSVSGKENWEDIQDIALETIKKALAVDTWALRSETMMLFSLRELAQQNFVQRIDIVNERKLEQFELDHLMEYFGDKATKLNFYEGSISGLMEDHPEYTTVICNDLQKVFHMIDHPQQYHCDRTVFLVRNSSKNMELHESEDSEEITCTELYNQEIEEKCNMKPWKIGRFASTLLEEPAEEIE